VRRQEKGGHLRPWPRATASTLTPRPPHTHMASRPQKAPTPCPTVNMMGLKKPARAAVVPKSARMVKAAVASILSSPLMLSCFSSSSVSTVTVTPPPCGRGGDAQVKASSEREATAYAASAASFRAAYRKGRLEKASLEAAAAVLNPDVVALRAKGGGGGKGEEEVRRVGRPRADDRGV